MTRRQNGPHEGAAAAPRAARGVASPRVAMLPIVFQPQRWSARATSIAGIEAELSRIWREAAGRDTLRSPEAAAAGRAVPRLAPLLDEPGDVRVRMRTSVLTLIVVARRPETAERAASAIDQLAARHPSRTIVLVPRDPDGPSRIDADITAQCLLTSPGGTETCTEQVVVHCGGELEQHLAELVTPLLVHDLPVAVWWPDDPPIGRRHFGDLCELADRLIVDSRAFPGDGVERLAALAGVIDAGRPIVCDIGWMRLTPWRELLAGLFDHPLLTPELAAVHRLRLDVARPGVTLRLAPAALFSGWLSERLGWELAAPLAPVRGGESLFAEYRAASSRPVRVELRPVPPGLDLAFPSPGALVNVELELGRRGHQVVARATRQADHLLATADWQGAEVIRRAARLEPSGDAPYLAEALEGANPAPRIVLQAYNHAKRLTGAGAA